MISFRSLVGRGQADATRPDENELQSKFRILFVDDEAKILVGLSHMLRRMRREWEMVFVENAEQALKAINAQPFHVVVSDMRMPGMDGASLLAEVRRKNPGAVRIILSGYSDEENVLKTVGPAHQYLAKPVSSEELTNSIRRSLALRKFVSNAKHVTWYRASRRFDATAVFSRVITELERPTASAASVAKIVANDAAMVAGTLKLINSPFFGVTGTVTDVGKAVRLLGFERIRSLVLHVGLFRHFAGNWSIAKLLETINIQSHNIGILASAIARADGLDERTVEECHCAGLLSQLGALVLLDDQPVGFREAAELRETNRISLGEAQARVFGAAQAELGAYLLGLWGFPDSIVEAVAFCQRPSQCQTMPSPIAPILHFANAAVTQDEPAAGGLGDTEMLRQTFREKFPKWSKIFAAAKENFRT